MRLGVSLTATAALAMSAALPIGSQPLASAASVDLVPHRAAYDIGIAGFRSGSPIVSVKGVMAIEWNRGCDGWTVEQRVVFDSFDADGNSTRTDLGFTSWEALDGSSYRFSSRTRRNDSVVSRVRGAATMEADGGEASYLEPEEVRVPLSPDTLFMTAHTRTLLESARAGDRVFVSRLFIGQQLDEPFLVSAVAGKMEEPGSGSPGEAADRPLVDASLLNERSWRFDMAFFPPGDRELPEFEVTETVLENGIVSDAVVDYGDFSFRYELRDLKRLPDPSC